MDSYEENHTGKKRYKKIKKILKKKFGYDNFRKHQYKIIDTILDEKDVTAVLPTGYGKSLCFQLPALYTKEPSIVISPLIALMKDQKMSMEDKGIKACCYNSTVSNKTELEIDILNGEYSIIYITPESVINCYEWIDNLYSTCGISLFAIDEAHCISSYGYDFRPSYRELYKLRSNFAGVPILAVTATATKQVIDDINTVMLMDGITVKTSFDRPNLTIHIKRRTSSTVDNIISLIKDVKGSHIVYCVTKKETEKLCDEIKNSGIKCGVYHAGLKNSEREETQKKFMDGKYTTIVATIAFGMGINKLDVRTVVHYGCPQNLESYYQEIGRAGRDGQPSNCYLYYSTRDFIIQQKFIESIKDHKYKMTRTKLLNIMTSYVNSNKCRKRIILEYFGDDSMKDGCNSCDNCCNKIVVKKKDDKYIKKYGNDIFRVLNVIKDVNCNYGTSVVVGIIRGSKNKKIPKKYYKNKFYGQGKNSNDKWWKNLIENLMDYGYISSHPVNNFIFVPKITDRGEEFIKSYNFSESMDVFMDFY
jgi:ATP-dependent DNA helicase RecQ